MRRILLSCVVMVSAVGCGDVTEPGTGTGVPVEILAFQIDTTKSQLVRRLTVDLSDEAAIQVDFVTAAAPGLRVVSEAPATRHELLLPRLLAEAEYTVTVTVAGSESFDGAIVVEEFVTRPLPTGLASLQFLASGSATTPLVMLELRAESFSGYVVVNNSGRVVWWWEAGGRPSGAIRRANGNFVFLVTADPPRLVEVTPEGQEVDSLTDQPGLATIHHDVVETDQQTLLFFTRDSERTVNDTTWIGDRIVEWNPAAGTWSPRWDLFDFYSIVNDRGPRTRPTDWAHANSLASGPGGRLTVSLQFLDQVISISPDFESIDWRLGGPRSDFTLAPEVVFSGQHAATEVSQGQLLMFDNGRGRTGAEQFSRAVEYELDLGSGIARRVWEFRASPDEWSRNLSSARRLANGNTLVLFGADTVDPQKVFEVTPAGDTVWQLEVTNASNIYRADPFDDIAGEVETGNP